MREFAKFLLAVAALVWEILVFVPLLIIGGLFVLITWKRR